jgi:RNA polymerase sigma factor (sigma-70 family)
MSEGPLSTLLDYLRRLVSSEATDCSDEELLERFALERDEMAFESLLHRYGPLVWSICHRILTQEHAAEDAFQATFLVLVRKAGSVSKKASIRSWLHGVALRVALRARQHENLRRRREQVRSFRQTDEASWNDVRSILDEEIQRLPEKYRLPLILCYLEGKTNDDAARLLNCPRGTVATRLARARDRLRSRLRRRGVSLSAGYLVALLAGNTASATVAPLVLAQTAKVALTDMASVSITALTEGVLHTMFLSKLKTALAFVLMLAMISGAGIGAYYLRAQVPFSKPEASSKGRGRGVQDKRAASRPEEHLQKLLKERLTAAEQEWKVRWELYRTAATEPGTTIPVSFHLLMDAAKRLLKAEVELSNNKAERLKAHEKYLKLVKEFTDTTEQLHKEGRVSAAAVASARYQQLDAEIELEREKAR